MNTVSRRHIVVIGGGITGLSAAWEASSSGSIDVTVLESTHRPGGKIRTSSIGGPLGTTPIDEGPDNFLSRVPWAVELCEELGLGDQLVEPAASHAGIWIDGAVVSMPGGTVLGVPFEFDLVDKSGILTPAGLARARSELDGDWSAPTGDVSIGGFLGERYGDELVERLVSPLVGGINAGNVHRLSLRAVTPQLWAAAGTGGSLSRALADMAASTRGTSGSARPGIFNGLIGGIGQLISALQTQLPARGVTIRTDTSVHSVTPMGTGWRLATTDGPIEADLVIIATPIVPTADIVTGLSTDVARAMRTVRSASVAMATLVYPNGAFPDIDPTTSGILVPRDAGLATTAISFGSNKWPHWSGPSPVDDPDRPGSGPPIVVRVSAGHIDDPASAGLPDDELITRVTSEVNMLAGSDSRPLRTRITRWVGAFPQYETGHLDLVDRITAELGEIAPTLRLAGASYRGLGIPACIDSGRTAARELLA